MCNWQLLVWAFAGGKGAYLIQVPTAPTEKTACLNPGNSERLAAIAAIVESPTSVGGERDVVDVPAGTAFYPYNVLADIELKSRLLSTVTTMKLTGYPGAGWSEERPLNSVHVPTVPDDHFHELTGLGEIIGELTAAIAAIRIGLHVPTHRRHSIFSYEVFSDSISRQARR